MPDAARSAVFIEMSEINSNLLRKLISDSSGALLGREEVRAPVPLITPDGANVGLQIGVQFHRLGQNDTGCDSD